jgi:2-keto-4-pentenoate hydratase/2-oxohepta-3-ene-1,7-dioic acid hydratase in catechol pathway
MKLVSVRHGDKEHVAELEGETLHLLDASSMLGLIAAGGAMRTGATLPLEEVRILAPIPRPQRNILCVGKNYHAHAREFTRSGFDSSASSTVDAIPEHPILFTKFPETVIASGDPIPYPDGVSEALDYEAEIAVVIGKTCRRVSKANALAHVFGYTLINDVTARDLQKLHKQWFIGKSLDGFCPMGPALVTADSVSVKEIDIECRVNGEPRQSAVSRDLIFDIPTLIETLSAGITLYPGDVIATGTPAGVGIGFDPPKYLKKGDVVEVSSSVIGLLTNNIA